MRILLISMHFAIQDHNMRKYIQKMFPMTVIEKNVIIKGNLKNLWIGAHVIIQSGTVLHLGGMNWCQNKGWLEIGDDSVISPNCVIYGTGPGGVRIGKRFDCGPGVMIFSSRTDYSSGVIGRKNERKIFKKVSIGNDVVLFAGVIINCGVTIGDGAVVGAGSVVLSDIPANEVWAGSPARFIKKR